MNAELVARDQERIINPTAYRTDYLSALKAFPHNGQTAPLIRMLDVAQGYTHSIDWSTLASARSALMATNALQWGSSFILSRARCPIAVAHCPGGFETGGNWLHL